MTSSVVNSDPVLEAALTRVAALEAALSLEKQRADGFARELRCERELRLEIQASLSDGSFVATLERVVARHADTVDRMQTQREATIKSMQKRMDDATVRHEKAILTLVAAHRQEVTTRLNEVLDLNKALFARYASELENTWSSYGTNPPSEDKEHWMLLAGEESEDSDGRRVITFKIRSGQKRYIDRISKSNEVIFSCPAANGIDVRQAAKKRMREHFGNQEVCWCSSFQNVANV